MTPDEFTTAVALTRMQPEQISAARRVLIDCEAVHVVAADAGLAKQAVSRAVARVKEAAGLVTVSVTLPAEYQSALCAWVAKRGGIVD